MSKECNGECILCLKEKVEELQKGLEEALLKIKEKQLVIDSISEDRTNLLTQVNEREALLNRRIEQLKKEISEQEDMYNDLLENYHLVRESRDGLIEKDIRNAKDIYNLTENVKALADLNDNQAEQIQQKREEIYSLKSDINDLTNAANRKLSRIIDNLTNERDELELKINKDGMYIDGEKFDMNSFVRIKESRDRLSKKNEAQSANITKLNGIIAQLKVADKIMREERENEIKKNQAQAAQILYLQSRIGELNKELTKPDEKGIKFWRKKAFKFEKMIGVLKEDAEKDKDCIRNLMRKVETTGNWFESAKGWRERAEMAETTLKSIKEML